MHKTLDQAIFMTQAALLVSMSQQSLGSLYSLDSILSKNQVIQDYTEYTTAQCCMNQVYAGRVTNLFLHCTRVMVVIRI